LILTQLFDGVLTFGRQVTVDSYDGVKDSAPLLTVQFCADELLAAMQNSAASPSRSQHRLLGVWAGLLSAAATFVGLFGCLI
jgi:hypothetical protein